MTETVEDRSEEALVLANDREDLARESHEDFRPLLGDQLLHAKLVLRFLERPQKADRDGLDPLGFQFPYTSANIIFLEGNHNIAVGVDPLLDLENTFARDDLGWIQLAVIVVVVLAEPAEQPKRVSEPLSDNHADPSTAHLCYRVRDDRGGSDERIASSKELTSSLPGLAGSDVNRIEDASAVVVVRRQRFGAPDLVPAGEREVSVCTTNVNANQKALTSMLHKIPSTIPYNYC